MILSREVGIRRKVDGVNDTIVDIAIHSSQVSWKMFDSVPRWFFYGVIAVYLIIVMTIIVVFADDTEDKGRSTMIDQLTKRVQEWNIQKAMNDSLAIADRFNCEYDESLCVLGIPDPDFNDIGVCFNSPELAEQYFKQTGINGTVPCPDFSISGIPKDESGK